MVWSWLIRPMLTTWNNLVFVWLEYFHIWVLYSNIERKKMVFMCQCSMLYSYCQPWWLCNCNNSLHLMFNVMAALNKRWLCLIPEATAILASLQSQDENWALGSLAILTIILLSCLSLLHTSVLFTSLHSTGCATCHLLNLPSQPPSTFKISFLPLIMMCALPGLLRGRFWLA